MPHAHSLRYPRNVSDVDAAALVAPAFGIPGDPAAIEAMVIERARARRRPAGTPQGADNGGAVPLSEGPRPSKRAHQSSAPSSPRRRAAYADPVPGHQSHLGTSVRDVARPLVGIEAATHAGLDTATTVQYITQLEHQLTALEAEHGRLCRVLLKSVAHGSVADCELAEATRRREITDEALEAQQRILGLFAKHLAHTAVTLGLHEQLSSVRTGDDPRRSFADAVASLETVRHQIDATVGAIEAAGASIRQRDSAWRSEIGALSDAVATARTETVRAVAQHGDAASDAVEQLAKELRRGMATVSDAVTSVETGTAVKLHGMLQQHTAAADAAATSLASAVGQLHNEVRTDERERQRYLSEQFHSLSRRLDDFARRNDNAASPAPKAGATTIGDADEVGAIVDTAVARGSDTTTARTCERVGEMIEQLAERLEGRLSQGAATKAATRSVSSLADRATAHIDGLCRAYADACFVKASMLSDEVPRATRIAEAAMQSLSAALAAAAERAQAIHNRGGVHASFSASGDVATLPVASIGVSATARTANAGCQASGPSATRVAAVQTTITGTLSRRSSSVGSRLGPLAPDDDDGGIESFPTVSDEVTTSGSPHASNVFGPGAVTQSMETAISPGARAAQRTQPPTPLPNSAEVSFEVKSPGGATGGKQPAPAPKTRSGDSEGMTLPPPKKVAASAPPAAKVSDQSEGTSDVDLSLTEDDDDTKPPRIMPDRRESISVPLGDSPSNHAGAVGRPPRPHGKPPVAPPAPDSAPLIEIEGVPLQQVTSDSIEYKSPSFRNEETFANLSINNAPMLEAPPEAAGMPDSVRSTDTVDDIGPSALGRRLAAGGGAASPRITGGMRRVHSPRGEVIPSPFKDAARLKRASSFDSPTAAGSRSPRNRTVSFVGGGADQASPASPGSPSPQRSREFSPQVTPRGSLGMPSPAGGTQRQSPNADSAVSTPSQATPASTPTASALHLGTKKRGLPALGGLGGAKTTPTGPTAMSFGVPGGKSRGGSGSAPALAPTSSSPGLGRLSSPRGAVPPIGATSAGGSVLGAAAVPAAAAGSGKAPSYDDWDDDDE